MRNFGLPKVTSRPASPGAQRLQIGSHVGTGADADFNSVASRVYSLRGSWPNSQASPPELFIPADAPLPLSDFSQTVRDIGALGFGLLFLCTLACSLPLAIFLLFFANY